MTVPYIPTPFATPLVNPSVGSTGAPPIPYISNTEYIFAPTGMNVSDLNPGGTAAAQAQSLADVIRRASRWADSICFGSDASSKGASLAASLTVDQATVRIRNGELRLLCDYRPIIACIGIAVGQGLSALSSLDPTLAGLARIGRRSITVPYLGPNTISRPNDGSAYVPFGTVGSTYAVWSYVNGYPHTSLAQNVAQGATSCVVNATDGNGGLWGVFAAASPFPGTELQIVDGGNTERVFVQAVAVNTPSTGLTTLTTSAFANAHTVPASPDFIPVTAIDENIHQAVISLTTMLVKTRGVRGLQMPTVPGARPQQMVKQLGQSGAAEDYDVALKLLDESGLITRVKHAGSY